MTEFRALTLSRCKIAISWNHFYLSSSFHFTGVGVLMLCRRNSPLKGLDSVPAQRLKLSSKVRAGQK